MLKACSAKARSGIAPTEAQRDLEQVAQATELVPAGLVRRLERLVQIARYYRKDQLARRAWKALRGNAWGRRSGWRSLPGQVRFGEAERDALARIARSRRVRMADDTKAFREDLERGILTLLGERRALGERIDWNADISPRPGRLWRFHLHYHEYLLDLATGSGWQCEATWTTIWGIVEHWIARYRRSEANQDGDAWHPYCVSRRLAVWLRLAAVGLPAGERGERILSSCAEQAEFLGRHLETDLGGNHLLENVYALALAGAALRIETTAQNESQSAKWLRKAERALRRELPRQILAHGEYFERSAMYHCQVLGNLLQMAIVSREQAQELAAYCRDAAARMWGFLEGILHPDGEIPLFGDSSFGESYPVAELRGLMELAGVEAARGGTKRPGAGSPYWVWRDGGDCLIFDAGEAAADSLPAHGHCDLLTFEASVNGERWFIDSGAYRYDDASMRRYCRSSVAHNVVTVDDLDQCDVWSAFRMGYRGRPISFETGRRGTFEWARAAHNAYRRVGVRRAERVVVASRRGLWGCFDHVQAQGAKRVTGRLHVAPGVSVERLDEREFLLRLGESRRKLKFVGVEEVGLAAGWHCPRFGDRERTRVFEYTAGECRNAVIGWVFSPMEEDAEAMIFEQGGETIVRVRAAQGGSGGGQAPFARQAPHDHRDDGARPVAGDCEEFEWRVGGVGRGIVVR